MREYITIKSLRHQKIKHEYQIRVDRESLFGNPYHLKNESHRDEVCDKYELWFNEQLYKEKFVAELDKMIFILKKYKKLELFCWCVPKRCHAETIKNYLNNIIRK